MRTDGARHCLSKELVRMASACFCGPQHKNVIRAHINIIIPGAARSGPKARPPAVIVRSLARVCAYRVLYVVAAAD